eukprot:CAMPEP_0176168822 /NCGR_PEP_ID=MMETSP0120_2-20121206/86412_1 /TAXON_ID=160619 /ORGANISM="Kryptoperidinium foliaceum, Strain CCMP 1326" /LENGTH=34 /DNA_ID= /DNA_START= /DNA_END= /DNA_ORIENTATION=
MDEVMGAEHNLNSPSEPSPSAHGNQRYVGDAATS